MHSESLDIFLGMILTKISAARHSRFEGRGGVGAIRTSIHHMHLLLLWLNVMPQTNLGKP